MQELSHTFQLIALTLSLSLQRYLNTWPIILQPNNLFMTLQMSMLKKIFLVPIFDHLLLFISGALENGHYNLIDFTAGKVHV